MGNFVSSSREREKTDRRERSGTDVRKERNSEIQSIQSNLNSSNTDGCFTMANSNSFLSPYEFLPLAQENKYLGIFLFPSQQLYVECLIEAILMCTHNIQLL